MTERDSEARPKNSRSRSPGAVRWLYGALLVAIGACIGIVIGSVSETPRMLLERMRGPVETVDLETPAAAPAAPAAAEPAPPLEAFGELQAGAAKPVPAAAPAPKREVAAVTPPPAAPKPAAPAVSAPPPAPKGKTADEIVRELQKKTPAPPVPDARHPVIQVLSLAERKQADALVAKLKSQGFDPYASAMPDKSGRFRVRVRPTTGQDPVELEQKLKALGLKTWATAE